MSEVTNNERAEWAEEAVETFRHTTHMVDDEVETVVKDLIANMFHMAKRKGFNLDEVIEDARSCFEEEDLEESGEDRAKEARIEKLTVLLQMMPAHEVINVYDTIRLYAQRQLKIETPPLKKKR